METGIYIELSAFQLTPSRRATKWEPNSLTTNHISTHALTEGDRSSGKIICEEENFNSRPHGGRRLEIIGLYILLVFQLTPSRRAT